MKPEDWDWSRPIFDHVEVSASDYGASVRFYETVLAALGIPRIAVTDETDELTSFGNLAVVDRAGIEAGFQSNGEPGYRKKYGEGYYAAFLFDPDGNNVEALYRDVGNIGHMR